MNPIHAINIILLVLSDKNIKTKFKMCYEVGRMVMNLSYHTISKNYKTIGMLVTPLSYSKNVAQFGIYRKKWFWLKKLTKSFKLFLYQESMPKIVA